MRTAGLSGAVLLAALALWAVPATAERQDAAPAGEEQPLAEAGARLEALLEATATLRANFEQRVHDASGRLLEEARGEVEIARPGRFRWTYTAPYEQLLVTDGAQVWMYDADLDQVSISRVEQAIAGSPAMLLGGGRLADGFDVAEAWVAEGLEWVVLVPRQGDGDFRQIALGHDGTVVRRMALTDALGQRTAVVFADIERGIALADERFVFVAPEGVDVIGPDGR